MNDTGIGTDLGALGPSPLGLFGFNNPTSQYQVPEYKAIGEGLGFTTTQNVSSYTCRCGLTFTRTRGQDQNKATLYRFYFPTLLIMTQVDSMDKSRVM